MSRSANWKILLRYPTLDSILRRDIFFDLHSLRGHLSFWYFCGCMIMFNCIWVQGSAQSWMNQINEAKDSELSDEQQIENLNKLIAPLELTEYQDTLGLVYYYIAWRHKYLNQHEEILATATSCISLFDDSGYLGYQLPYMYQIRAEEYKLLRKYDIAIADAEAIRHLPLSGRGIEMLGESIKLIAQIYIEKGEYQSAISQIEYTLSSGARDSLSAFTLTSVYYELSKAYFNFSDSISMVKSIDAIQTSSEYIPLLQYEDEKLNQKIINGLQLGNIAFKQGRLDKAVYHYEESRNLIPIQNRRLKQEELYETLTANLIYAYEQLEEPTNVERVISTADIVNSQLIPEELKEYRTVVYENIASYYRRIGNLQKAQLYMDSFFQVLNFDLSNGLGERSINLMPYKKRVIKGLLENIQIQKSKEDLSYKTDHIAVVQKMNLIDKLIDAINQELLFESSILQWREDAQEYYKIGIDLAFEANDHEAFWNYAEKSKSLALLDEISNNNLFSKQDSVAESVNHLRQLRLQESQFLLQDQHIDSIQNKLIINRQQQSDLLRKRNAVFKKKIPEVVSLDQIKRVKGQHSLIHYIAGVSALYAIVIQNGESKIYEIGNNSDIQRLSLEAFNLLKNPIIDSQVNLEESRSVLKRLCQLLMNKIENLNDGLFIIPEGNLSFIPFDALVQDSGQYLLFKHHISYQLSGTLFSHMLQKDPSSVDRSVVVLPNYQKSQYQELSSASIEKDIICELIFCEMIDSQVISKQDVYRAISQSELFHYAGHAVMSTNVGEDSYLAISDSVRISEKEIYNLTNDLQLVTLSACETGLGEILEGEGISNLSRGFIYSGTQSIVQSLWQVNDGSSTKLMELFYLELIEGVSKSKALHNAKIAYINTAEDFQRTPYYWSSFVLIGRDDSLSFGSSLFNNDQSVYLGLFALVMMAISFLIYRSISNRRRQDV